MGNGNFHSAKGKKTCTKSDVIFYPPSPPCIFSQCVADAFLFPLSHLFVLFHDEWFLKSGQRLVILAHDAAVYPKVSRCCRDTPDTVCSSAENMKPPSINGPNKSHSFSNFCITFMIYDFFLSLQGLLIFRELKISITCSLACTGETCLRNSWRSNPPGMCCYYFRI